MNLTAAECRQLIKDRKAKDSALFLDNILSRIKNEASDGNDFISIVKDYKTYQENNNFVSKEAYDQAIKYLKKNGFEVRQHPNDSRYWRICW